MGAASDEGGGGKCDENGGGGGFGDGHDEDIVSHDVDLGVSHDDVAEASIFK